MPEINVTLPQGIFKIDSANVVNIGQSYDPLWLLQNEHGQVLGLIFASHEQAALDGLVNAGKLDSYLVDEDDFEEIVTDDSGQEWLDGVPLTRLGNAGELFDISMIMIGHMFKVELSELAKLLIEVALQE